jgi:hypothetical protein
MIMHYFSPRKRLREIEPQTPILFYSGAALEIDMTIALSWAHKHI